MYGYIFFLETLVNTSGSSVRNVCNAGWPVANRIEGPDNSGLTMVATTKRLCSGQLTTWTYQGKISAPFRAIIFRPAEGSKTQFKIVGINDIPAGAVNVSVVYSVPKADRITVHEGDVIGWSFGDGFLTFDTEERHSMVSAINWIGGNLYAGLITGMIVKMNNKWYREYSIKATVERQDQGKFDKMLTILYLDARDQQ